MLLAIDAGNTNVVFAAPQARNFLKTESLCTCFLTEIYWLEVAPAAFL